MQLPSILLTAVAHFTAIMLSYTAHRLRNQGSQSCWVTYTA